MSAATELISKKWLDWVVMLFISLLVTMATIKGESKETTNKEREDKINNAASVSFVKEYVGDEIKAHKATEEARYQGILDILTITNERLKEIGINNNAQFESLRSDIRAINAKK